MVNGVVVLVVVCCCCVLFLVFGFCYVLLLDFVWFFRSLVMVLSFFF